MQEAARQYVSCCAVAMGGKLSQTSSAPDRTNGIVFMNPSIKKERND